MPSKTYPIAAILNFADGRLLTSMADVYDFANYMTGDNLFTHQLPRAFREVQPVLRKQLPFLAAPEFVKEQDRLTSALNVSSNPRACIDVWLREMAEKFGAEHAVTPLSEWMQQDPVSELIQMRESKEGIILVQTPEASESYDIGAL